MKRRLNKHGLYRVLKFNQIKSFPQTGVCVEALHVQPAQTRRFSRAIDYILNGAEITYGLRSREARVIVETIRNLVMYYTHVYNRINLASAEVYYKAYRSALWFIAKYLHDCYAGVRNEYRFIEVPRGFIVQFAKRDKYVVFIKRVEIKDLCSQITEFIASVPEKINKYNEYLYRCAIALSILEVIHKVPDARVSLKNLVDTANQQNGNNDIALLESKTSFIFEFKGKHKVFLSKQAIENYRKGNKYQVEMDREFRELEKVMSEK